MGNECAARRLTFSMRRDPDTRRAIVAARGGQLCAIRDDHVTDRQDADHTDQDHREEHRIDIQHDLDHDRHQGIRD